MDLTLEPAISWSGRVKGSIEVLRAAHPEESARWNERVNSSPFRDVYYRPGYALACEEVFQAEAIAVVVRTSQNAYLLPMLKRALPPEAEEVLPGHFDTVSPYGYGGLLPLEIIPTPQDLCECLDLLKTWCLESRVVSCYFRLHPLFRQEDYMASLQRPDVFLFSHNTTFALDLSRWDEKHRCIPHLNKGRHQDLKRARQHLRTSWDHQHDLQMFRGVYEPAMKRMGAEAWYCFPDAYYEAFHRDLAGRWNIISIFLGEELVGAGLQLHEGSLVHGHLNAVTDAGRALGAATLLYNEVASWARATGRSLFHLGGGRVEGDSLHMFKRSFHGSSYRYHSAGLIGDMVNYTKLSGHRMTTAGQTPLKSDYFPLYRA